MMIDPPLQFHEHHRDPQCRARTGVIDLPHGPVATPTFMPVGTAGTVKAIRHDTVEAMGYRLILANTYHLFLRPGTETIAAFGGLHRFSSWDHNILTDSGGYQIFSLAPFRKITDEGAHFQSHIDGARHMLTPERAVEIQVTIGSDIQMVLDVCTGPDQDRAGALEALDTTTLWAGRARDRWREAREESGYRGALFGIVQGNFFPDLRTRAVEATVALDLPGIAIGGLSVGESFDTYEAILAHTAALLPAHTPRYVMGIGTPEYILTAIEHGIDMFDCVFPTRAGRNGTLFTTGGRINLKMHASPVWTNRRIRRSTHSAAGATVSDISATCLRQMRSSGRCSLPNTTYVSCVAGRTSGRRDSWWNVSPFQARFSRTFFEPG